FDPDRAIVRAGTFCAPAATCRVRPQVRSSLTAGAQALAKVGITLHASCMAQMHDVSDPRNAEILINVNGELKSRGEAVVSVFDSGFMLGDGVWEGLRVHKGKLGFLDRHLDRLFEGAKAIAMDLGMSREEI